jgi:hypothetical protein
MFSKYCAKYIENLKYVLWKVGIGPTLFGYLVLCKTVQSARKVAMESFFLASVVTITQKKIKMPPSWISAKSENKKS